MSLRSLAWALFLSSLWLSTSCYAKIDQHLASVLSWPLDVQSIVHRILGEQANMKRYKNISLSVSWYIKAIKAKNDFLIYWGWDFSARDLDAFDNDIRRFWAELTQAIWIVVSDFQDILWLSLESLKEHSLDILEMEDSWFTIEFSCLEWNDCWNVDRLVFNFDSEWILMSINKTWDNCDWISISYNQYLQDYMTSWLKRGIRNECILSEIWEKVNELFYYITSKNPYLYWYVWENEELYVWRNPIMITFGQSEKNWNMIIYLTNDETGKVIELWDMDFLSMDIDSIVSIIATNLANAWWYD